MVTIANNDTDGSSGMPADLHSFYARGVYGIGLMTAAKCHDERMKQTEPIK